jgi:chemotaxis protein methyltransferase CheR
VLNAAMNSTPLRNLSHISFEGKATGRRRRSLARGAGLTVLFPAAPASEERLDEFISWVLGRAGLDAAAYRPAPLHRRLPACLRALKVRSTRDARELLERKPRLVAKAVGSLLIGVTEFFREPGVFDSLRAQVLPAFAGREKPLRVWSAACSTGAELYSIAIVLSESGLLEQSYLLGTDCRSDAIERAKLGLFDAGAMKLVPSALREKYFEPVGQQWRPVERLRRRVCWKAADLLAGVERGPWDILFWRNTAIYLRPDPAEAIWRELASVLAPGGVLVGGKADRPPRDAALRSAANCIYRVANDLPTASAGDKEQTPPTQRIDIKERWENSP